MERARSGLEAFFQERLGLSALRYSVPEHANSIPYLLGGISLMGFGLLLVTGIYLAQFYHPVPTDAHDSVVYIITGAPLGDVVRSVHYWVAQFFVLTVVLHLLRIVFTGSFKRPREFNWYVGLGLFVVTMEFAFTGTVLKFDQEAVEALQHNIEWAQLVGGFGAWFSPDFSQSVPLLTRVFVGHIAILPMLFTLLIVVHFFFIKQHGISPKVTRDGTSRRTAGEGRSHFDVHIRRMVGFGLVLLGVSIALSLISPAPLGMPGVAGAEVTRPPWMFVWLVPFEDWLGTKALVFVPLVLGAILALVPVVDRTPFMSARRRPWTVGFVALTFLVILASGALAELRPVSAHLGLMP
ncbi:MAG TPA: cytochrome b N-terminal domain-containing protein [Candidatus Limnocylindria bacterium]